MFQFKHEVRFHAVSQLNIVLASSFGDAKDFLSD